MRPMGWHAGLAALSVLLTGLAARTSWNHSPSGQLAWDGDVWHRVSAGYTSGAAGLGLSVIADLQQRLLLRLENQAGASLWIWVEQSEMPERWQDLRRAVYSPRKSSAALPSHDFSPPEPSSLPPAAVAVSVAMQPQNVPQAKP